MKQYLCNMGAWVIAAAVTASAQTSSSGGSQSTSGTSHGNTSRSQETTPSQGTSSQNQQNLPPGLQNRDQLPPGLQNRDQFPPGLAKRTNDASLGATNLNQFGGSSRFGTNGSGASPTGRGGETNRMYGTNSNRGGSFGTNNNSQGGQRDSLGANNQESRTQHRDEAVTTQDRTLLINIRQKVQTEVKALVTSSAGAWAPVNFKCDRGVVTIFGTVQSIEIKQQIAECVRRVPGVIRVEDSIVIAAAGGGIQAGGSDQVIVTRVREKVLPQIQVS